MLKTCEGRLIAARELINEFRNKLETISGQCCGEKLSQEIDVLCKEIDSKMDGSRSQVYALATELDRFYRRMIGETYTKADLMIYLNQQKNDIQDRYGALLKYPEIFLRAHDTIHHFYCQDQV